MSPRLPLRAPRPEPTFVTADAHARAVRALQADLVALPPTVPVRLAKPTSNLFRARSGAVRGLDVSHLTGVLGVDPRARTAEVQGMCTYETLVEATLPYGLMPLVVPQLKTITLGGAVTGLGIESTSFAHGLPHESVLEMDVLTASGALVTARPAGEHADLFSAFPNSYGSLGYATRLRIKLAPIGPYVATRNLRFTDAEALVAAIAGVIETRAHDGEHVDAMDGVAYGPREFYLVLGRFTDTLHPMWGPARPSDYTGQAIYYRSIAARTRDTLTAHDYLWRWDPDWFWCSGAFGAQHRLVRRAWPRRYRRSDVYRRLLALDQRYSFADRLDRRRGGPGLERVIQDVEVPLERAPQFLAWFYEHIPMQRLWLCPLVLAGRPDAGGPDAGGPDTGGPDAARGPGLAWPLYPLPPRTPYLNIGLWGTVPRDPARADGAANRDIERAVADAGGHKSLYSDAFYDRDTFEATYGGERYRAVRDRYDPEGRLNSLYEKVTGS